MTSEKKHTHKSKDTYDHVLKYTGIFSGVQLLKALMGLLRNKLAAVFLGTWGMGMNANFLKLGEFVNSITNFGIPFVTLRSLAELAEKSTSEEIRKQIEVLRTWGFFTSILSALICLLSIPTSMALVPFLESHAFIAGNGLLQMAISAVASASLELCSSVINHKKEVIMLSLYVASLPVEACECAILKGLHQLKSIAVIECLASLLTFAICIPLFYALGIYGVALSLVICGWVISFLHLFYTCRLFAYRISPFNIDVLRKGMPLVRMGSPFMLSAIITSLSMLTVYFFLDDMHVVGLYNAAYGIVVAYAGMVLVAVETDYFPRLSAASQDKERTNEIVNQQMTICLLLVTPMLIVLVLMMARVFRLLYTEEFVAAFPMSIFAIYCMFCKTVITPMGYMPLAKGHSGTFLVMETAYNIYFVILMYVCYNQWQLIGTGIALSISAIIEVVMLVSVYSKLYGFRMKKRFALIWLVEFICLTATIPMSLSYINPFLKYGIGLVSLSISLYIAYNVLSKESDFVKMVQTKLKAITNR